MRIGPLPEPTLLERLRSSWSLDALIPSFEPDPSMPPRKGFRVAGVLALVVHASVLIAVVLFGRYAIMRFVPEKVVMIDPSDYRPPTTPDTPGTKTNSPEDGGPAGGSASEGGGSNTDTSPATAGVLPKTSPIPSPVPLNLPPPPTPVSLPVVPTTLGPDLPIPAPTDAIGLPGAPDAPGDPSAGNNGGRGIGNGPGGDGVGSGPNGPGGRGPGPGPGGTRGGGTPGSDNPGPGGVGGGGVMNRNVRIVSKAKPTIPKKMVETQTFGTVTLSVTIGADGSVLSVVPVNTLPGGGTQAAIDAVYRCRFSPAIRNGVAVTETTVVRFDIRPN